MAAGSIFAFFGGWALFAHAPKPAPVDDAAPDLAPAPLPTLPSLAPNTNQTSPHVQPLPTLPPSSSRVMPMPRLRTHGS